MSEQDTSAIQPATSNLTTLGGSDSGKDTMNATHALTPITGTNGYQQLIAFDREKPLSLSVTNASGKVSISGSDQDGVWVVVRRSDGMDAGAPEDIPVTVSVDGNTISIHPDWTVAGGFANLARKIKDQLQHGLNPSDWDISNLKLNPDLNFDIRVELPRELVAGSKVSAKTASGALAVTNLISDVSAVTASGRIEASSLTGHVTTHSASGSITVDTVDGSLEINSVSGRNTVRHGTAWTSIRSVSGRIDIDEFTMKYARIASVSGSVRARFTADNNQDYTFSTVSGSVKLDVTTPADVTARLNSKSASGSAHASGEWVSTGRKSWSMGSGENGPVFDVKTVSGSMKCMGQSSPTVASRNEPLPEHQMQQDSDSPTDDRSGFDMNMEMDFEGMSSWAKDFARDFRRNFSSLATPPEPEDPPTPAPPTPPEAPTAPVTPPQEASVRPKPDSGEPWTWSSASGATPPTPAAAESETPSDAPAEPDTAINATPDATAAPEEDVERLRVLEALERGDIDIDEALTKLDSDSAPRS